MTSRNSASHAEWQQQPQKRLWRQAGISHLDWIQAVEIKPSTLPRSRQCQSSSCHHGLERTRCCRSIGAGYGSRQDMRGDLPRNSPLVPAPAIRAHLALIVDDRAPQVVRLSLIIGRDLERKRHFVLEHRAVVQAKAGHARYPELYREHIALFAGRIVARSVVDGHHHAVWKDSAIERRSLPFDYNKTAVADWR